MRRVRSAAIAAFIGSLILANGTPAFAAVSDVSTGLTEGQRVGNRTVVHPVWTGSGITGIEVMINSRVSQYVPATVESTGLTLRFASSEDGKDLDVTVRVRSGDESAEATTRVHVDVVAPTGVKLTPATETVVHGLVPVTATDVPDDIAEMAVRDVRTGAQLARVTAAPWVAQIDSKTNSFLTIEVTDLAGNSYTYIRSYYPDYSGPYVSPEPGEHGDILPTGHSRIYTTVTDASKVDRIEFWADGQLRSTGRYIDYDFGKTSRTGSGWLLAWDEWGNERINEFTFRVDGSGPVVTAMTPANGALVRGSRITSTLKAADVTGVQYATLVGAPSDFTAPYASSIAAGADGRRPVTWYLVDSWGNSSTFTRYVTVDNTKPALRLTSAPKNNAKVKGTVKIAAAASDRNGVNRVELLLNGKLVAKDVKAGYAFSFKASKYGKKIKMQLRAYDRAGNITYTTARTYRR
ncbi:Ig-like domain-containing protein [Actinoplanes sp. NPDC026619]|uniref:Ig-like domain-containing protein n=1 Tax=Actinoplanes sp. NPDC026619 TaxID=3155798 RepID=UPI0033DD38F0